MGLKNESKKRIGQLSKKELQNLEEKIKILPGPGYEWCLKY